MCGLRSVYNLRMRWLLDRVSVFHVYRVVCFVNIKHGNVMMMNTLWMTGTCARFTLCIHTVGSLLCLLHFGGWSLIVLYIGNYGLPLCFAHAFWENNKNTLINNDNKCFARTPLRTETKWQQIFLGHILVMMRSILRGLRSVQYIDLRILQYSVKLSKLYLYIEI